MFTQTLFNSIYTALYNIVCKTPLQYISDEVDQVSDKMYWLQLCARFLIFQGQCRGSVGAISSDNTVVKLLVEVKVYFDLTEFNFTCGKIWLTEKLKGVFWQKITKQKTLLYNICFKAWNAKIRKRIFCIMCMFFVASLRLTFNTTIFSPTSFNPGNLFKVM